MRKRANSEDKLQTKVASLLDASGLLWAHHAAERASAKEGARAKRHGQKPGVPDVMIYTPPRDPLLIGLAIELKSASGRLSSHQRDWLMRLTSCGWRCEVCRSLDEVVEVLRQCYPDLGL